MTISSFWPSFVAQGSPTWSVDAAPSPDAPANSLSAVGDYVSVASSASLNFAGPVTMAVWLNTTTVATDGLATPAHAIRSEGWPMGH